VEAWGPLRTSAVIGRAIDFPLLSDLHPESDLAEWVGRCGDAGILDFIAGRWTFAHDKLREAVLETVSAEAAMELHRRVAVALEGQGASDANVMALAHHWREVGDPREAVYAERAGLVLLRTNALREAITYFERALELESTRDTAHDVPIRRSVW